MFEMSRFKFKPNEELRGRETVTATIREIKKYPTYEYLSKAARHFPVPLK
jgi:hypothetical protein